MIEKKRGVREKEEKKGKISHLQDISGKDLSTILVDQFCPAQAQQVHLLTRVCLQTKDMLIIPPTPLLQGPRGKGITLNALLYIGR